MNSGQFSTLVEAVEILVNSFSFDRDTVRVNQNIFYTFDYCICRDLGWSTYKPQCYWQDESSGHFCDDDWDCDGNRTCEGESVITASVCQGKVIRPDICGHAVPSGNVNDPNSFQPNPVGYSLVGRGYYDGQVSGYALPMLCNTTDIKGCAEFCVANNVNDTLLCKGFIYYPFHSSASSRCCYPQLLPPPANADGLTTGNDWDIVTVLDQLSCYDTVP